MVSSHVLAQFSGEGYGVLADLSHFIVAGFVFASGMSLVRRKYDFSRLSELLGFWKRRFLRLLVPYWLWTLFLDLLVIFQICVEHGRIELPSDWFSAYFLFGFGGPHFQYGWLILLFAILALLFPAVYFFRKKKWLPVLLAIVSVLAFIFLPAGERIFVALGYLPVLWLGLFIGENRSLVSGKTIGLFLSAFFCLFFLFVFFGMPVGLYSNKHPPSPLFLIYGCTIMLILLFVSRRIQPTPQLSRFLEFISANSLLIFLAHFEIINWLF